MTWLRLFFPASALFAFSACSELPDAPQILSITPGAEKRELRVDAVQQLTARVNGRAVAAIWTTSDTAIARIDTKGLLRIAPTYAACGWMEPGQCEVDVVARADGIVSSQKITVLPNMFVERVPPQIDLEMGDSARVLPRFTVEGREVFWCVAGIASSRNTSVARIRDNGHIVAGDVGVADVDIPILGGRICPGVLTVPVVVIQPFHTLTILPADAILVMQAGQTTQLSAQVTNWKGVTYAALDPRWSSSDSSIITVEGGRVAAMPCRTVLPCQATVTVRSGRLTAVRVITVQPTSSGD